MTTSSGWRPALLLVVATLFLAWAPACGGSSKKNNGPTQRLSPEEEGKKALTQAIEAQEAGKVEEAVDLFQRAQELRPGHYETTERYARFLLAQHRPEDATKVVRTYLEENPAATDGLLLLADAQIASRDYDGAYETLTERLALEEDAASYARRGEVRMLQGKHEEGLVDIEQAIKLAPNEHSHRVALARALIETGDRERAATELEEVLAEDPENVPALLVSGALLRDQRELEQAFERHQKAVDLDRANYEAHYELGITQFFLGKSEEAEASLEEATRLAPHDAQSWYVYGELVRNRGAAEEAAVMYRKARDNDIDHDKASTKLALMLLELGTPENLEEGITVLTARLERHPEDSLAYFLLGEIYEKSERYAEAVEAYERYLNAAERDEPDVATARRKVRALKRKLR
ncbi:tetratricopeptide repeat protein [Haliangium sp.]|uniref:tetratricopeptide repeat protein n=1 Tax=Haliangium sp. TaxID=2663208 RepID=UPI003D0E7F2E